MHTEEDEAIAKRPDQALASPRFSRAHFMGLPLELRLIIWDLAIPRRATVIREEVWEKPTRHIEDWESCYPTYATYRFDPPRRAPAVAHVCREAREVCRPGRMFSADSTKNIPPHERQRYPVGNRVQFSWFDPDRDALMVELVVPNESYPRTAYESHCIQAIGELARTTQHVILVDAQYMHPQHCFIEALYNPRHFPRLQTVSICTREVEVRSPKILRLLREVCWMDQEESDNPIIQLTDDYEVANAREIDELQRRLKALAATTGDDGDKVDALCSSLAQLKEPTRPGLFPRPRVGMMHSSFAMRFWASASCGRHSTACTGTVIPEMGRTIGGFGSTHQPIGSGSMFWNTSRGRRAGTKKCHIRRITCLGRRRAGSITLDRCPRNCP
ncbi:hypothetical protein PG987_012116 [Apiospora arundinis]